MMPSILIRICHVSICTLVLLSTKMPIPSYSVKGGASIFLVEGGNVESQTTEEEKLENLDTEEVNAVNSGSLECVKLDYKEPQTFQSDGDVVIGGFFPLHYMMPEIQHDYHTKPQITPCHGFDHRAFRWMMTMVFAVEEINNNPNLLPNVKLGYRIMDSCDNIRTSLQSLFSLISYSKTVPNVVKQTTDIEIVQNVSNKLYFGIEELQSVEKMIKINNWTQEKRNAEVNFTADETTQELQNQPEKLSCVSGSPIPVVIGLASSSPTRAVAQVLGALDIPLVSYFATCTCLTDKHMYPSFLRTVPSDYFQVRALVKMVTFFDWLWLGTIGTTDDYSQYGIQAFSAQFKKRGGCVSFHLTIPTSPTLDDLNKMVETLQSSTAKVVVVFAPEGQLLELFMELAQRNVTGLQWVASEAWVTANLLTSPLFHPLLEGTVGFSFPGVSIPGLREFLLNIQPSPEPGMEFINKFWEEHFGCKIYFSEKRSKENTMDTFHNFSNMDLFGFKPDSHNISPKILSDEGEDVAEKPACSGLEDLSSTTSSYTDVSQVRISYNVYKAVYAIAHALHNLLNCDSSENNKGLCDKQNPFTSKQLLHHLKNVNFTDQFKEKVHFDSNSEPVPLYDIINWQKNTEGEIRFIKVGSYDGSVPEEQQLRIKKSNIVWTGGLVQVPVSKCSAPCPPGSRQARREGEPSCCFDCIPCADGEISNQTGFTECVKCPEFYWSDKERVKCVKGVEEFLSFSDTMGIILVAVISLGVIMTSIVTIVFHRFRTTPIVKANNSEISFLLLLSIKLCFLCALVFIGQPSVWTCKLRQATFGISFVICLSCLLVKTIVVLLAFQSNGIGSRKLFGPSKQKAMIVFTTAPQICLCTGWLLGAPPFPFRNPAYQALTGKIVVECKEPWPPGFYLVLSYIGLLAFVCLLLAFLGRKLPDTFNEAKLITFSMLIFWAVWLSFIPAYVSSPGKFSVAVEIFAILASSFGLLLCIFVPKCYIILLHPERNVKRGMTGKFYK